jgi:formylglycine-generating enzyme
LASRRGSRTLPAEAWRGPMMLRVLILAMAVAVTACGRPNVQCVKDSNCDLIAGGRCATAPTGNMWCAYADPNCPGGYRYADQEVGDGVSGTCVMTSGDAGIDAGTAVIFPSCKALALDCGATGNDDCCNSPELPAGSYYRTYDTVGDTYSGDRTAPASVSKFRLDRYEVTVGRFRTFVAAHRGSQENPPSAGAGAHPIIDGSGWNVNWNANLMTDTPTLVAALKCDSLATWTDSAGSNENRPINCVTWYEAMAFCAWDGGYLPTEAEWNYAAAGGSAQRAYPWSVGATIDATYASYSVNGNCIGDGVPACAVTDLVNVGTKSHGDGEWGQSDLGGNVYEWMLDVNDSVYMNPCNDCARLAGGALRVLRGGSFRNPDVNLRAGTRGADPPGARESIVGLRCARASRMN